MTEDEIQQALHELDEQHSVHASMVTACAVVAGAMIMFAAVLLWALAQVTP